MFGYVRPREDTLPDGALERYTAVYCGLCHTLGEAYGTPARLFLNYDFAFLAMLLAPETTDADIQHKRCFLHPFKGKPACKNGEWLSVSAAESLILSRWKLMDTLQDDNLAGRLEARSFLRILDQGYQKAREKCPAFDASVQYHLRELRKLEQEECPMLDRVTDNFAALLQAATPVTENAEKARILEQLLYHIGRWIYLIDAVDDLEEDRISNRYNPVAARFPQWTDADAAYLRQMMDHSLSLAGAAFQLLEPTPWTDVLENILYSGLPSVEELVFSGRWREHQKKHRRKSNERSV